MRKMKKKFEVVEEVVVREGSHLRYAYSTDHPYNPDNILRSLVAGVDSRMAHMREFAIPAKVICHIRLPKAFERDRLRGFVVEEWRWDEGKSP